jgi:hypothetical protein
MLFLTGTATKARTDDPLQSFSVVRFFFSDDLSAWNHTILDVTPVGKDVRVRLIQLALANPSCGALLVRAVEHVFPRTTVARVARTDVCSHTERSVDAALASQRSHRQSPKQRARSCRQMRSSTSVRVSYDALVIRKLISDRTLGCHLSSR